MSTITKNGSNTCYTGNEEEEDLAKARANWAAPDDSPEAVKYRVEQWFSYGWATCWYEDEDATIETTFDSHADAWAEIDDLCSATTFDEQYVASDFRVVKVSN